MRPVRSLLKDDSGQVLVITALCMVVLLAFLGLAIDVGHLRLVHRQMQTLADAAAMAGGLEIRVCSATASCPAMQAAVKNAMVENKQTSAAFLMNCATPGTGLTVTLNDPPCALGSGKDPNTGNTKFVEAVVTQQVHTYFAWAVGYDNVKISARAEAKRGVDPCIWALNPHIGSAITAIAALGLNSTCGIVVESDSTSALSCLIGVVNAPTIKVTGKVASLLCGSSSPITTGAIVPTPADPMAYLPVPPTASDPCPTTNGTVNLLTGTTTYYGAKNGVNAILGSFVFNPGVYCGGISITAALASSITFNPGVYILRDGTTILNIPQGGLNLTLPLLANITGNGVMFYNQGNVSNPAASVGSLSITAPVPLVNALNLSAATSGTYGGVLFWQARGVATSGTYLANLLGGGKFEGAIYQPSAKVAYAVGLLTSSYNILVADQINFTGQVLSTVGSNYAALANGSPLHGDTAVLVQ
ncbi:Tad domain-containing protein [Terriglobus roseus]|uniref:Putative Flp pilus-assembly TadE/G-like n=1 Tax=Terriglobus roseus TaxID=392734 RepID=A0A1H4Q3M5_9BACT|nr:Tad domain-containing protein [Terriglobus roseus]SEC14199.1 Putative Flp pilus-assembly TadE/G-like [Terriglobus roseus]